MSRRTWWLCMVACALGVISMFFFLLVAVLGEAGL